VSTSLPHGYDSPSVGSDEAALATSLTIRQPSYLWSNCEPFVRVAYADGLAGL
jgi:hypothetical protein